MPANSPARRLVKKALHPLLDECAYGLVQAATKAWDIATGGWFEPELELVPGVVELGDSAIDIGANYGLYTFHLSRAVGPAGRVIAFEPIPFTHATLRHVVRFLRLQNVELHAVACGERQGRLTFQLPIHGSGPIIAGLAHRADRNDGRAGREREEADFPTREVDCDVIAIDDYLLRLERLAFIKCDIEGAEIFALRGAVRAIETHHPTVVCEVNPWYLEGFGITTVELAGFFLERDYECYRWQPAGDESKSGGFLIAAEELGRGNVVFLHPERAERIASRIRVASGSLCR